MNCIRHVISNALFLAPTLLPLAFFTFSILFMREPSIMMERGDKGVLTFSNEGSKDVIIKLNVLLQDAQ
jgi:hypothetical protein